MPEIIETEDGQFGKHFLTGTGLLMAGSMLVSNQPGFTANLPARQRNLVFYPANSLKQ